MKCISGVLLAGFLLGSSSLTHAQDFTDWGSADQRGPSLVYAIDLAGNSLTAYPYFEYVRAFNQNAPVKMAIDPNRYPQIVNRTAEVYVVEKRSPLQWQADPSLGGSVATVTFHGSTIQDNTFQIIAPFQLAAEVYQEATGDFTGLGHGYDMVVDMNHSGTLDAGDFIDGLSGEAGFYVVHDTTMPGPLAVTEVLYSVGTLYGIPAYCTDEDLFYPTDITDMGELPLVVVSHGNGHDYRWYGHIGHHLGSYGFIVMSHQNDTMPGPEWASFTTLGHTDAFLELLPSIAGGALVGHVDPHRITWLGHSRGGEGVAIAFDRIMDVPPSYLPTHYAAQDIIFIDSMLPVDFTGTAMANPHWASYHLWTASGDADVNGSAWCDLCQTFHLHERATRFRQSTVVQGTGHAWFHNYDGGYPWFEGPCPIYQAGTHLVQLGLMLPMYKHYVEGNIPGEDYLWRQYETFHPPAVPVGLDPCYVVSQEYRNGAEATAFIDDYESHPETWESSSGGIVSYTVLNLAEGRLDDGNWDFSWTPDDPFNGATQNSTDYADPGRGVVFDWKGDRYYIWEVVPGLENFSNWKYLSLRGAQGTQHPYTLMTDGILTFSITLADDNGTESSINTGAYGGGFGMPYDREDGWHNEMRRIRIRTADFLTNGSGLDLSHIIYVRLDVGPSWGTPQGRIVIDELMLDNDVRPTFTPLTISIAIEPPVAIPPHLPYWLPAFIEEGSDTLVPESARLYYRFSPFVRFSWVPLQHVGTEMWGAFLPGPQCGQTVEYFFKAEGYQTGAVYDPAVGASHPYSALVGHYTPIFEDDFENDLGWAVQNDPSLTSGKWDRSVPGGWPDGSPPRDYDGSGKCYVTENVEKADVDGGPTILISPVFNLAATRDPVVHFAEWFFCVDTGSFPGEVLEVLASNDGGANWILVQQVVSHSNWATHDVHLADYMDMTKEVVVGFSAQDSWPDGLVEAGVDAVRIYDLWCD